MFISILATKDTVYWLSATKDKSILKLANGEPVYQPLPSDEDRFYFTPSKNETTTIMTYTFYGILDIFANIENLKTLPSNKVQYKAFFILV
jgi:hypothetical protein